MMISHKTSDRYTMMNARPLIATMRGFRDRTLALVADLDDQQMIGPRLSIVNPPLWEIGHVAWTQEFWVLRHLRHEKPMLENADQFYNSTDVAHDTRWELLLPNRANTLQYMGEVIERCIARIDASAELSRDEFYFHSLATFHEGMHAEALAYTRQTLGYPPPSSLPPIEFVDLDKLSCPGDVEIPGGKYTIGASKDFPFVFDNEKWEHEVAIQPFAIARAPVTNGEFLAFVEDDGYRQEKYWSPAGWHWRQSGGAPQLEKSFAKFFNKPLNEVMEVAAFTERLDHPVYWHKGDNGRWQQRVYNQYVDLGMNLPVVHVSWYEAEAYCNWAGRRLPSEAEWEIAASAVPAAHENMRDEQRRLFPWGDQPPNTELANLDWRQSGIVDTGAYAAGDSAFGCRQMIGNVWEWTADDFQPYPNFSADPYKEYSQPWFGSNKVLRGGCWATSSLLIRNSWRNFYTPDRRDVWAGFRTCAK